MIPRSEFAAAGLLLVASLFVPSHHTQAATSPLLALAGTWSGGGILTVSSGTQERVHCRASYGVAGRVRPIGGDPAAIERGVAAFASSPNGGLIVPASAFAAIHRELIIKLAARYQLPAVYGGYRFVTSGGLLSYGPDLSDLVQRVAGYVDRILRGERPADLPVQAPTKYDLVINLKTAKALGLEVPPLLLSRADEVIE
jgi:hypothetical protein